MRGTASPGSRVLLLLLLSLAPWNPNFPDAAAFFSIATAARVRCWDAGVAEAGISPLLTVGESNTPDGDPDSDNDERPPRLRFGVAGLLLPLASLLAVALCSCIKTLLAWRNIQSS